MYLESSRTLRLLTRDNHQLVLWYCVQRRPVDMEMCHQQFGWGVCQPLRKRNVLIEGALEHLQEDQVAIPCILEVNQQLIAEIRQKVPLAPWLQLKDKERVSEMPVHVEVLRTEKIGYLYNLARKEVADFFSAKLPIADFHGLITNEHFTREMSQECRLVNRICAEEVGKLIKEKQALDEALAKAEAEYQANRNDQSTRNEARTRRNAARSAVHAYKERSREEFQALRSIIRAWGDGKKQNRRGWCQSLHAIICAGTRAARSVIQSCATRSSTVGYWLDIGNNADSGQFILGEPLNYENRRTGNRLRTVADLYPEVVNTELEEDSLPSCSAAEALERQEPFVNTTLANHSLSLLAHLFRYGMLEHHGGFVNLATGHTTPLRIDPATWRRIQKRRRGHGAATNGPPVVNETVSAAGSR